MSTYLSPLRSAIKTILSAFSDKSLTDQVMKKFQKYCRRMQVLPIATTCLNVHALDVKNNGDLILDSINIAHSQGAKIRCGAELELSGYSCLDHFYEPDLIQVCVLQLEDIIKNSPDNILCCVGTPLEIQNKLYNCLVIFINKQIKLIRPKGMLCDDGNYRESRYFTAWNQGQITQIQGSTISTHWNYEISFGDCLIETQDFCLGIEMCEELFIARPFHTDMYLNGADVILNPSGSHHQLRKLNQRVKLVENASTHGIYVYNNLRGCDGERVYFDGTNMIFMAGRPYFIGQQFNLRNIDVQTINLPLKQSKWISRQQPSRVRQSATLIYQRLFLSFELSSSMPPSKVARPVEITYSLPEEEIMYGPACYLWDYLRKSGLKGVFVPLSGGIDSCTIVLLVFSMCKIVCNAVSEGNKAVISDLLNMVEALPEDEFDLCNKILHTAYMSTEYSSIETRKRAAQLASFVGAYHLEADITSIVNSFIAVISSVLKEPNIGNSYSENIALQNIQARSRMVLSYCFSILVPWFRNTNGNLLVLGTANVDESLRGYFTKYDCSSADLNLIGSISKTDLKAFVSFCKDKFEMPFLSEFIKATPTAELRPGEDLQSDEVEMKMTYEELSIYGRLRKIFKCGPISMYNHLLLEWSPMPPKEVLDKVKTFFHYYGINRHKMAVITPSYHAESYSPDDNRYDLRPLLYKKWDSFYSVIEEHIEML
eukprot:NODE_4_length_77007_cov_1.156642.p5 type:complete len:712 gc:universal NODE_4_length_77007_cov_1.156642:55802-57937(+)